MARGGSKSGGRGGPKGPVPREVLVSKKLSWLLRHGAEKEGLTLGRGGYVSLADVLANRNFKSLKTNLDEIKSIVANNEKQRFSLIHVGATADEKPDGAPNAAVPESQQDVLPSREDIAAVDVEDPDVSHYLIRANQGHSLAVSNEGLLVPITIEAGNLPAVVVHGTRHEHWQKILASGGLKPMTRQHVHFATGVPEGLRPRTSLATLGDSDEVGVLPEADDSPKVRSGMRNTSTILIYLNLRAALADGLSFWISENGVVLSDGGAEKLVRLQYFERVEERDGRLLVRDGKTEAESDKRWIGFSLAKVPVQKSADST